MKKLRWQIIIIVVAIAAIAIILLGQQPIAQTIVPEAALGGIYFEGLVGAPSRYNPLLDFYNQVDKDVDRLIYSRLIKFDSWGNPVPELAETWGVNVSGDVFNITLRENAKWHDGETVTTEDVLFTIDLMRDPEMPIPEDLRALWASVDVIAFDDYTIQFRLQEPYSPFIDYLSIGILPAHLFIDKTVQEIINDPSNLAPVGSGPYEFEELIVENGKVVG
ncbi:MAG: ABC transporter substrate-binding protein, partial [Chloroflexota bacterium]